MERLSKLNFRHLFYFWRVAKLGHLTRAAAELHTSQSALSTQIKQLEHVLGTPLFERGGRRLHLTAAGQLTQSYADSIFGIGQELLGRIWAETEGLQQIRIGSVSTLSRNYLENWIRPLLRDEAISLTLESGSLQDLLTRLTEHQLDVVLANDTVPNDAGRLLHCRLLETQAVSLIGPSAQWAGQQLRIPDDLDRVDLALPSPRHALRLQFDALCLGHDVKPRIRAEVDDMAMLRLIARDSGWLAVLPDVVVQDELRSTQLSRVARFDTLQEHFYAITTPHRHQIERLDTLLEHRPGAVTG